jgi:hypothetical protein
LRGWSRGRLSLSPRRQGFRANLSFLSRLLLRCLNLSFRSASGQGLRLNGQGLRLSGLGTSLGRPSPRPRRLSRSWRRLSLRRKSPPPKPSRFPRSLNHLRLSSSLTPSCLRRSGPSRSFIGLATSLGRPSPHCLRLRRSRRRSSRSPRWLSLHRKLSFLSRFPRVRNQLSLSCLTPSCLRLSGPSLSFIGPDLRLPRPGFLTRFSRESSGSPRRLNRRQLLLSRSTRPQNVKSLSRLPRVPIHKRRRSSRGPSGLDRRLSGLGSG